MTEIISNRHIRHDWQTFVDWEQQSVRTMCGVTTRRHLAGIPGVTIQPQIVNTNAGKRWGWCTKCVVNTFAVASKASSSGEITSHTMKEMYRVSLLWMKPQNTEYLLNKAKTGRTMLPDPS